MLHDSASNTAMKHIHMYAALVKCHGNVTTVAVRQPTTNCN